MLVIFTLRRRPESVCSTQEELEALDDPRTPIINALYPATDAGRAGSNRVAGIFRSIYILFRRPSRSAERTLANGRGAARSLREGGAL